MKPIEDLDKFINMRRTFVGAFRHDRIGPTVHCNVDADMTRAIAFRKRFKAEHPDVKLTFNDMIIKAAANALPEFPLYTCSFNGEFRLIPGRSIDIRFPVDVGEHYLSGALVREADKKTLEEVSTAARESMDEMAEQVKGVSTKWHGRFSRFPRLLPLGFLALYYGGRALGIGVPPLQRWFMARRLRKRGTFLITNVGPTGVRQMEGPIVWPDILHLMIAATRPVPVLKDGQLTTRPMMPLIAKFDHRMTDVGPASAFLHAIRENLEDPENRLGAVV